MVELGGRPPLRTAAEEATDAGRTSALDVATYLHAELTTAGLRGMILNVGPGLAVLSIADDFALWTDGARTWWQERSAVRFHRVTRLDDLRRLVFGRYHAPRRSASGVAAEAAQRSVEEVLLAGERLRDALVERGITWQDMDVFTDSRVAVVYTSGILHPGERRRVTITVSGGTYLWPATAGGPGCLRCRSWHDVAQAATEIAGRLRDEPADRDFAGAVPSLSRGRCR